jgi:hypothetical protein
MGRTMNAKRYKRAKTIGGWPIAVTLETAAELLGVDLAAVQAAAAALPPYVAADGTRKWSVRRLAVELGVLPPQYKPFTGRLKLGG